MAHPNTQHQIDLLRWMLEDVRKVTLAGVEHLTKEQLFQPPIEGEYPIGSYLMHFCEADIGWLETISGKKQSEEIKKRAYYGTWYDSGPDYEPPKEPIEVREYFEVMKITRNNFLEYVSSLKDPDLEDIITRKRGDVIKTYTKKWIIYHILEHEAHTRGQIFMLIRKAGWKKK
jgi:uncharacterized damage-inducible protein DinB